MRLLSRFSPDPYPPLSFSVASSLFSTSPLAPSFVSACMQGDTHAHARLRMAMRTDKQGYIHACDARRLQTSGGPAFPGWTTASAASAATRASPSALARHQATPTKPPRRWRGIGLTCPCEGGGEKGFVFLAFVHFPCFLWSVSRLQGYLDVQAGATSIDFCILGRTVWRVVMDEPTGSNPAAFCSVLRAVDCESGFVFLLIVHPCANRLWHGRFGVALACSLLFSVTL